MSKEGTIIAMSGAEAVALDGRNRTRAEWYEAWHELTDRYGGPTGTAEDRTALGNLERLFNAMPVEEDHVIHARLCRVLPHLADVLAYLVWPEYMQTPEWLSDEGLPLPWAAPLSEAQRIQREVSELFWKQRAQDA